MNYLTRRILFQEIPEEISLSYLITGCPLRCVGCHSTDSWNSRAGHQLNSTQLQKDILKYKDWVTCVLFMGGEWEASELENLLDLCISQGIKTALYTGLDVIAPSILQRLTFLKTGSYRADLAGLDSLNTNQKLIEVNTGRTLNNYFHQQQGANP